MPGWDTAFDAQTDLINANRTQAMLRYLDNFAQSLATADGLDMITGERTTTREVDVTYQTVAASVAALPQCEPIYVSSEISEIIDYAAESFQPEPIIATDVFSPMGFAYFGTPLGITDVNASFQPIRAIQWVVGNSVEGVNGLMFAIYTDDRDEDPESPARGGFIGGSHLTLLHISTLPFGDARAFGWSDRDGGAGRLITLLKVFFRLAAQEIAVPYLERAQRPVWKRAHWRDIKEVTVFRLRRAKHPQYEGEEHAVEWSHRWLVQGHWRNQPYKEEGKTIYRQIWIAPFVKGPDNKPLIFKRRAFEFVR